MTAKAKNSEQMRFSRHGVDIRDDAPRKYGTPRFKIVQTVSKILTALGWKNAALSLWLVSDAKMKQLNKKHLGHNWPTDVISFSQWEGRRLKVTDSAKVFLGDLIISLDTAARQGKEYGNSLKYEFYFYVCHGILHLMGYDDKTPRQAKRMEAKQTSILKKIGLFRKEKVKNKK